MSKLAKLTVIIFVIAVSLFLISLYIPGLWSKNIHNVTDNALKNLINKPIVEIHEKSSFLIHSPNEEPRKIEWKDVQFCNLNMSDTSLDLGLADGTKVNLKEKEISGWTNLLRAIPDRVSKTDSLKTFIKDYFQNLECCKICGLIAVKDGDCLSCGCNSYEKYFKEYPQVLRDQIDTEKEYLKREQLFWFEPADTVEVIKLSTTNFLYPKCDNWTPVVTEDEVKEYYKNKSRN